MNKALKLLLFSNALVIWAGAMFGPIYAIYIEKIGGGILEASWAVALSTLATATFLFIFGRKEDRMKEPEIAMALGYLIIGAAFFGYIFSDSLLKLFVVQIVLGVGTALYSPAFDGLYSQHLDNKHTASQWAWWEIMSNIINSAGALIGGVLASKFGFGYLFATMGVLCVISAFFIWVQPRKAI